LESLKKYFDKIIYKKLESCELFIGIKDDKEYLIFIFKKENYIYFKIMIPAAIQWDCSSAIYYPLGLFGFAKTEEELIGKILEKIERLKKYEFT
jgi:hypothetical protein